MKRSKDLLKGVILGTTATFLLTSGISYAAQYPFTKKINAVYNNIKVIIDGVEVNPTNEKGQKIEPFTVDGTIYLPLRGIATGFGKDVEWNQQTKTVTIGAVKTTEKPVNLDQFNLNSGSSNWTWSKQLDSVALLDERKQPSVNLLTTGTNQEEAKASYQLNGEYEELKGNFAVTNFNSQGLTYGVNIIIKGDGKNLFETYNATKETKPTEFKINVSGIQKLEVIVAKTSSGTTYAPTALWDIVLTPMK